MKMETLPILILVIGAVIGGGVTGWSFQRRARSTALGVLIGAVAGGIGSLLFMLPLNFCTFEAERSTADVVFGILLIALGIALVVLPVRWIAIRLATGQRLAIAQASPGAFKGVIAPWLLLAPTLVVLALFLYYPSLDTFRLSTLLAGLGAPRTAFVCVDNYTRLVADNSYLNSVVLTLLMAVAIVVMGLSLSLLVATMAYQPIKGAKIYRALLIWPYAISPAVAGVIFLLLFNPTGGIINYFLSFIGIKIAWLNDPAVAPWAVILASVWKSMGYNILFYLAGLQNVPKDLLEAAAIDGANAIQRFIRVVIPMLSPITFFLVITNMTYAFFDTFGTVDYLTGGGPLSSTTTMMYRIFQVGVKNTNTGMGKAAAESIILFVMVIGLTYLQFRTSERQVTYGA